MHTVADAAPPDLAALRASLESLADSIPAAADTKLSEIRVGAVRCLEVAPVDAQSGGILYVHGGAFCLLRADPYAKMAGHLARATRVPVLIPDYRLPPEHPYPRSVLDVLDVYTEWIRAGEASAGPFAVAGDSAGANLALATLTLSGELGIPLPTLVVLFSPWLDLMLRAASVHRNRTADRELHVDSLVGYAQAYAGAVPLDHPLVSPRSLDRLPFPPLVIQAAADELLVDDARALAKSAEALGVETSLDVARGMQHNYQFWGPLVPRAMEAYAAVAARLDAHRGAG